LRPSLRLHQQPDAIAFYSARLSAGESGRPIAEAIEGAAKSAVTNGPYGCGRPAPLRAQEAGDLVYRVSVEHRRVLGPRIAAALEHAHLLAFSSARFRTRRSASPVGRRLVCDGHRDAFSTRRFF
jgi:hypothetical protein